MANSKPFGEHSHTLTLEDRKRGGQSTGQRNKRTKTISISEAQELITNRLRNESTTSKDFTQLMTLYLENFKGRIRGSEQKNRSTIELVKEFEREKKRKGVNGKDESTDRLIGQEGFVQGS